jgi:hypothetical protein
MIIKNLPKKYNKLWDKCAPLLKVGRPGDLVHAMETVKLILSYDGNIKMDEEILIPVAIMHDIGHVVILPKHFKYVTGSEKIANGKLAHMLAGAKIANDILTALHYDKKKIDKIVEIISIHDFDQLKNIDIEKIYNTVDKKFFHDIDSLDRYTKKRLKNVSSMYKDRNQVLGLLEDMLSLFFYDEFREIAKTGLSDLRA